MRIPYKRVISKDIKSMEMNLPDGKYCKDCFHFQTGRCKNIYGRIELDEICDWYPCRFIESIQNKTPGRIDNVIL